MGVVGAGTDGASLPWGTGTDSSVGVVIGGGEVESRVGTASEAVVGADARAGAEEGSRGRGVPSSSHKRDSSVMSCPRSLLSSNTSAGPLVVAVAVAVVVGLAVALRGCSAAAPTASTAPLPPPTATAPSTLCPACTLAFTEGSVVEPMKSWTGIPSSFSMTDTSPIDAAKDAVTGAFNSSPHPTLSSSPLRMVRS